MANDLVRKGYDEAAEAYIATRNIFHSKKYLEAFCKLVPKGRTVLDVGCGGGKPIDDYLVSRGLAVNGIDISPKQIALAKQHVPEAFYEVKDMSYLVEGEYGVDGIVSFYAVFHTPREKHPELFTILASFLPTGGPLLITMGSSEWEGTEDDFHGVKMFWSHYDAKKNTQMIKEAGFEIILDEIDTSGNEKHQVILAKKR